MNAEPIILNLPEWAVPVAEAVERGEALKLGSVAVKTDDLRVFYANWCEGRESAYVTATKLKQCEEDLARVRRFYAEVVEAESKLRDQLRELAR